MMKLTRLVLSTVALLPALASAGPPPQYRITDLGVFGTGDWSQAFGMSSDGRYVVGRDYNTAKTTWPAFLWSAESGMVAQSVVPGHTYAAGYGVNNSGVSVGLAAVTGQGGAPLPVMWSSSGQASLMTLPTGQTVGRAYDINDKGLAVGSVGGGANEIAALYNTVTGTSTVITALSSTGSYMQTAWTVNNSGLVVGTGVDQGARSVPMVYNSVSGVLTELQMPAYAGTNNSLGFGLSDNGQYVVGYSGNGSQPFIWSASTGAQVAALPAGSINGGLRSVNDSGWAVGYASTLYANPWLYADGQSYALRDLIVNGAGWDFNTTSNGATGISNDGSIVGFAVYNGTAHAFLMTQVPEPASYALMLGGLLAVGAITRRRKPLA